MSLDISQVKSVKDARLVYVKGLGKFSTRINNSVKQNDYGWLETFTLNDVPLLQIDSIWTGTSAGFVAAGYGIENTDCPELEKVREEINKPFESLTKSISILQPILELFETGLYVVADAFCFPADGNGNFFWNVKNDFTIASATEIKILWEPDFNVISIDPVFVYPTQSTDKYSAERVEYYKNLDKDKIPRAICYNICNALNLLIDGHHKACAAALKKEPFGCLLIIPFHGYNYIKNKGKIIKQGLRFNGINADINDIEKKYIDNEKRKTFDINNLAESPYHIGDIIKRKWEDEYIKNGTEYLTADELAQAVHLGLAQYNIRDDRQMINELLDKFDHNSQCELAAIIMLLRSKDPSLRRELALICAKKAQSDWGEGAYFLMKECLKSFLSYPNDEEIIDFCVDYLVNSDNDIHHSEFTDMANKYLDNCN